MPVTVLIPTALRKFTSGAQSVELPPVPLPDLLDHLVTRFPDISRHLRDDRGELRRFVNIYVNDEDIRFVGGSAYKFKDGDEVLLVPSIAGGAPDEVGWVSASAPASSANLGCAFDCAALALNLRLRARALARTITGFAVKYRGPNPERVPCDASNLVVEGIVKFAALHGANTPGAEVEIENEIPVGVGLGSSAAAIVCGLLLGAALLGIEPDREEILAIAAKIEGHPDNAAAACHGGLVFAAQDSETGRILYARTVLPPHLKVLAIIPGAPTSTKAARAALPREYSRADVVHNMQRASLLAAICFSGATGLEQELFRDRVHQPYRAPSVPGLAESLETRHPDLLGVCMSGSGSSAIAFVRQNEAEIARLLAKPFADRGASAEVIVLRAESLGAQIEAQPHAERAQAEIEIAAHAIAGSESRSCKS